MPDQEPVVIPPGYPMQPSTQSASDQAQATVLHKRARRNRTQQITGYFEPDMVNIIDRICFKHGEGRSSYIYRLVLKDAIDSGFLTHDMAVRLKLGEPLS